MATSDHIEADLEIVARKGKEARQFTPRNRLMNMITNIKQSLREEDVLPFRDHKENDPARSEIAGRALALGGAVLAPALAIGALFWGYNLVTRDVSNVPVVQEMERDFRVAPADPGGMQAPYQGLEVNNIARDGAAATDADVVTLAPDPVELAEEDRPLPDLEAARRASADDVPPGDSLTPDRNGLYVEGVTTVAIPEIETSPPIDDVPVEAGSPIADIADGVESKDMSGNEGNPRDIATATDRAVAEALAFMMDEGGAAGAVVTRSPRPTQRPRTLR